MQNKLFFDGTLDSRNRVRVARRKTSNKKNKVSPPEINEKVSWHLSSVSDCCKQILVVLVQKPPLFAFTIDSNLDLHFHYNYNSWYHGLAYISPQLQQSNQLVNIKCSWTILCEGDVEGTFLNIFRALCHGGQIRVFRLPRKKRLRNASLSTKCICWSLTLALYM